MKKNTFANSTPRVVWYLGEECVWKSPPESFEKELLPLFQTIYSQKALRSMEGYNPVIVGYDHASPRAVVHITKLLADFKKVNPQCRIAMEILPPESYEWITGFLRDEKEYNTHGTIHGKKPAEGLLASLLAYRSTLAKKHGAALLLWLLENKFSVTSIEHPSVLSWISKDEHDHRFAEGKADRRFGALWHQLRPFYTAIRRDIHGLGVLEKEQPDIICVGIYHAMKYDLLLKRDGKRSYYYVSEEFVKKQLEWKLLLKMWKTSHEVYKKEPPE